MAMHPGNHASAQTPGALCSLKELAISLLLARVTLPIRNFRDCHVILQLFDACKIQFLIETVMKSWDYTLPAYCPSVIELFVGAVA